VPLHLRVERTAPDSEGTRRGRTIAAVVAERTGDPPGFREIDPRPQGNAGSSRGLARPPVELLKEGFKQASIESAGLSLKLNRHAQNALQGPFHARGAVWSRLRSPLSRPAPDPVAAAARPTSSPSISVTGKRAELGPSALSTARIVHGTHVAMKGVVSPGNGCREKRTTVPHGGALPLREGREVRPIAFELSEVRR